ncbi:G-D-S-L family lipolytic protein [Flavobacteriaceae bacterium]|nr:G-D-S-L family lipolytic protein [Flavobacteriaceae bacterium]
MKMNFKYLGFALLALGIVSCESDDMTETAAPEQTVALTAGDADFSNYVALGASFTAGFTDGALFKAAQTNSFPNTLATQFAAAGGGDFNQPMMTDNVGGLLYGGNRIANPRLYFNGSGPAVLEANPTTEVTNVVAGVFNNMGVPGAKSFHFLANGYGNLAGVPLGLANPYFARMASSANASMLEDAVAQNPTFFTLSEFGGNDVLGYATSGGSGVDQTGNLDPTTYGSNDITDPNVFAAALSATLDALTANGAKGVVGNVPYVTSLPYFTTVPYAPLDPSNPDFGPQIPLLNETFGPLNQVFDALGVPERKIIFSEDMASPVVIVDESLPNIVDQLSAVLQSLGYPEAFANLLATQFGQSRQASEADLMVLTSASYIATVDTDYAASIYPAVYEGVFAQVYAQAYAAVYEQAYEIAFQAALDLGFDEAQAAAFADEQATAAATVQAPIIAEQESPAIAQQQAGQLSVNGITKPLADQWVLTGTETQSVLNATDAYNATIDALAAAKGLAKVDLKGILQNASSGGVQFDGFTMSTDLVFGGLASLDGVHLTARGYALMANEFLVAIDATYGSNFIEAGQRARANDFPVNYAPELQ